MSRTTTRHLLGTTLAVLAVGLSACEQSQPSTTPNTENVTPEEMEEEREREREAAQTKAQIEELVRRFNANTEWAEVFDKETKSGQGYILEIQRALEAVGNQPILVVATVRDVFKTANRTIIMCYFEASRDDLPGAVFQNIDLLLETDEQTALAMIADIDANCVLDYPPRIAAVVEVPTVDVVYDIACEVEEDWVNDTQEGYPYPYHKIVIRGRCLDVAFTGCPDPWTY